MPLENFPENQQQNASNTNLKGECFLFGTNESWLQNFKKKQNLEERKKRLTRGDQNLF